MGWQGAHQAPFMPPQQPLGHHPNYPVPPTVQLQPAQYLNPFQPHPPFSAPGDRPTATRTQPLGDADSDFSDDDSSYTDEKLEDSGLRDHLLLKWGGSLEKDDDPDHAGIHVNGVPMPTADGTTDSGEGV